MTSYHSDPAVKSKYVERVLMHQNLDHLVQGIGWENGSANPRGCAVGCTLESYEHDRYPLELGLPLWLAHLEDHIFEALPKKDALNWPAQFLEAIPIGIHSAAFDASRDRFQIFWLERQKTQIDQNKYPGVLAALDRVISLLSAALSGNEPESAAWSAARSAAWSAARSAAESEAIVKRDWLLAELTALGGKP